MSDAPRGDSPEEAEPTIRRPRLFASGREEDPAGEGPPDPSAQAPTAQASGRPDGDDETQADGIGVEGEAGRPAIQLAEADEDDEVDRRRKRRITVTAISVGAAVIVIALCAGSLGIVSAVHSARDHAADARSARSLREADCLELEARLNHLTPPGATATPAARSAAVQDEDSAVRIYLTRLRDQGSADAWRQLLDARTTYAQSLGQESKTRTAAFFVAPRDGGGAVISDQLLRMSPAQCAGSIRRLAQPDL